MFYVTPIPKPPERKLVELDANRCAKQESIPEAVRAFLRNAQETSQNGACFNCGSNNDLIEVSVSLSGADETWQISLPLCERCVLEESGSSAFSEDESTELSWPRQVGGALAMNTREKWKQLYLLAAVEVDGKKMRERIAAVREAIQARLQDLAQSSDPHEERQNLGRTLRKLDVLEADAQKW